TVKYLPNCSCRHGRHCDQLRCWGCRLRPPDFTLTPKEFYEAVTDSPSRAGQKYGDKIVAITGTVFTSGRPPVDPSGPPSITRGGAEGFVVCSLLGCS